MKFEKKLRYFSKRFRIALSYDFFANTAQHHTGFFPTEKAHHFTPYNILGIGPNDQN